MNDRAILVTGSSSGIGKAIVAALLEAGAQVIGVSRTKSTAFSKNTSYTDINVDIGDNISLENELRIVLADLFVLALVAASAMGLFWSYLQSSGINGWDTLFLVLFAVANIILFGGVYWSKFAHMFYKPGAAIQKNLAKADGSNDDLPMPADAPEDFGLGISREKPKHY